jgi:hypothetical protein
MGMSGAEARESGTHHITDTTSGRDGMEGLRSSPRRLPRAKSIGRERTGRFLTFPSVTYEPNPHDDAASHGSTAQ